MAASADDSFSVTAVSCPIGTRWPTRAPCAERQASTDGRGTQAFTTASSCSVFQLRQSAFKLVGLGLAHDHALKHVGSDKSERSCERHLQRPLLAHLQLGAEARPCPAGFTAPTCQATCTKAVAHPGLVVPERVRHSAAGERLAAVEGGTLRSRSSGGISIRSAGEGAGTGSGPLFARPAQRIRPSSVARKVQRSATTGATSACPAPLAIRAPTRSSTS